MKRSGSDKLLNWGFAVALTLHAVVLAAAAALPTEVAKEELAQIQVFDTSAPSLATPVELVEWQEVAAEPAEIVVQQPQPEINLPVRINYVEPLSQPKTKPTPIIVKRPQPTRIQSPQPAPAGAHPGGGGGGGGGFVEMGTPSASGDLAGVASGGTGLGEVPGAGSGSGRGTGPGSGGGSGGGAGGGVGSGHGTGQGEGSGSGAGGGEGDGGSSGFVSRVADRKDPVVISKGNLVYPPSAVEAGVEGVVKLEVLVSEDGKVTEAKVAKSSRDRRLDAAAVEFIKGWRYKPAVQDGKPRSVWTHAVVTFELK